MRTTLINISDKEFIDACLSKEAKDALFVKHKLVRRDSRQMIKIETDKNGKRKEVILDSFALNETDETQTQFWYNFSDKCRFCGGQLTAENITKVSTYWNVLICVCHKECKVRGMAEEAYECQMIDADCNYCKWFIRGKGGMNDGMGHGNCGNPEQLAVVDCTGVICQSNTFAGKYCFEHRKPFK